MAKGQANGPNSAGLTPVSLKTKKDFREVIDIVNVEVVNGK
jgi:hypothetical protein